MQFIPDRRPAASSLSSGSPTVVVKVLTLSHFFASFCVYFTPRWVGMPLLSCSTSDPWLLQAPEETEADEEEQTGYLSSFAPYNQPLDSLDLSATEGGRNAYQTP